jgi:hypothetical protein
MTTRPTQMKVRDIEENRHFTKYKWLTHAKLHTKRMKLNNIYD